ncbi:MAG: integrase family protein, partial [Actinomycetia bacterium]|nr:integrase family protein [Actinomycetes bacterium]
MIERERVEGTTKSGRSRAVSIDADTAAVLRAHRAQQKADRLALGEDWRGTGDYVFTTAWGEPIYPSTPTSLMTKLVREHNAKKPAEPLPAARLHDLRHIHATTLLVSGVAVHVVAARLGHADPAITLQVYAHVVGFQMAAVADIFAKAIEAA